MYRPWLDEGFARPGARRTRDDFEIAATCHVQIVADADEKQAVIDGMKPIVALYMGGMGAKDQNFHKQVFERMGYEAIADQVQELYLDGHKDEAATALIPDELVDDMHIIGTEAEVTGHGRGLGGDRRDDADAVCRSGDEIRRIAEVCSLDAMSYGVLGVGSARLGARHRTRATGR